MENQSTADPYFYASATKHLGIGMSVCRSVCRSVSTQLSKKFGDIGGAAVLTVKSGQRPACSQDNCTVQCTVHVRTQQKFWHEHRHCTHGNDVF